MKLMAFPAALCAGLLLAGCANEPVVAAGPSMPPPKSVAEADLRLAAVAQERTAIEARFVERERVCYQKFFVTRCLDDAKERHRTALAAQHAIEVDAERFKRQDKVDERDRALAEADAKYREDEAHLAAQPPAPPHQPTEAPPPRPVTERVAKHEAKVRQEQQQEAADAAKRAANARAYEQRKKESDERQRKVQERLAEKRAKDAKAKGEKAEATQQQTPPQQPAPNSQ